MDETWGLPLSEIGAMTHWPEQPNPVPPIVEAVRRYLQSGDYNPVHEPGTEPRDYLRELARNPDIMAKNIDQASAFNFGGVMKPIGALGGKLPPNAGVRMGTPEATELPNAANLNKTPTEQFINEYDALVRKKAAEINREDFRVVPTQTAGRVPLSEIGNEVPALKVSPSIAEQVKG